MSERISRHIMTILRILPGIMFICSAVFKLASIDSFEIYLYSFNIFDFVTTTLMARLLIAAELVMGCLLILKLHYNLARKTTILVLFAFTAFLIYVALFREDDNCYCFGEIIEMKPAESIIKNLITIGLLFITRKEESHKYRRKALITSVVTVIAIAVPFLITPPDVLYNMMFSSEKEFNKKAFIETFSEDVRKERITVTYKEGHVIPDIDSVTLELQGRKMLIFITPGCRFCMTGMKKIDMMAENLNIDKDDIKVIAFGHEQSIAGFLNETGGEDYECLRITPPKAIDICLGHFPTFVFTENGNIAGIYNFRQIDDKTISRFLK